MLRVKMSCARYFTRMCYNELIKALLCGKCTCVMGAVGAAECRNKGTKARGAQSRRCVSLLDNILLTLCEE